MRDRLRLYLLADALHLWEWAQRSGRMSQEPSPTLREWFGGDAALDEVLAHALPAQALPVGG